MPAETGRTTARKVISLPGGQTVSIPVITKISFVDPSDRYQETQHTIDNSANSARTVHVDHVPSSAHPTETIDVERIDIYKVIDASDRYQETQFTIDNVTGNDTVPPSFTNHFRRTVIRYYSDPQNPNDNGAWVESELIDELRVLDPSDRYQETRYVLNNNYQQADPSDPNITDPALDPPYRTDLFQNIVDWNYDTGTQEPFFRALAWATDTTIHAFGPSDSISGAWDIGGSDIDLALAQGYAYMAETNAEIDIRFVDQFFEPHTYDTPTYPAGTGDIRGYTYYEWTVGFSNTPVVGLTGGIWYTALQDWKVANPTYPGITGGRTPAKFDFPDYGFTDYLKSFYDDWYTKGQSGLTGLDNPRPAVWVRFSVIGPITTANPNGRY